MLFYHTRDELKNIYDKNKIKNKQFALLVNVQYKFVNTFPHLKS